MGDIWKEIYDSSLKFLVPLDTQETYMAISNQAINLVGGGHASIFLFVHNKLKKVYTTYEELKKIHPREDGVTYEVFRLGIPQLRHKDELLAANKSFENLPVESNISIPLIYGHITIGVLSLLSKEGKKFTEEDLQKLVLFAPLATIAIRKTQYIKEAEDAVEVRNLFISLAEHEIKNPLTAILLNIESLKNNTEIQQTSEYETVLKLHETAQRLVKLVNELLQSSVVRDASLKYSFKNENFIELCKSVVNDISAQYDSHKFIFKNKTGTEKVEVNCDGLKIRQVLNNLLDNAVKFSPETTIISLTLDLSSNKDRIIISVKDRGIGIPKENLTKIFRRFYRGTRYGHGMGIGLYLVKEIVDKHQGIIDVKSKVGEGTTVSVEIPISNVKYERNNSITGSIS